jgi:membrane-bound inhibitor of C-type lysozyme
VLVSSRLAFALLTLGIATAATAADDPTQRVVLDPGTNATTVTGTVTGYRSLRYYVAARGGRVLSTSFTPSKKSLYYNVLQGSRTLHDGSSEDNLDWSTVVAADGDYAIDVYFKSSDARRNAEATFILSIAMTSPTVNYRCADGRLVTVTYTRDPDPGAAQVVVAGKTYDLRHVVSDSGARYSANKVIWWTKGREGTLELDGPATQCNE